jgi:hypothetical protein
MYIVRILPVRANSSSMNVGFGGGRENGFTWSARPQQQQTTEVPRAVF